MFGKTGRGAARDEARNDKLEEEGRGGKRGRGERGGYLPPTGGYPSPAGGMWDTPCDKKKKMSGSQGLSARAGGRRGKGRGRQGRGEGSEGRNTQKQHTR